MGFLDSVKKRLQGAVKDALDGANTGENAGANNRSSKSSSQSSSKSSSNGTAKSPAWGSRDPDKADYGKAGAPTPDMDSLVTDAEIETVTGALPIGEPRRNGPDGSDSDLGRHVIRESQLSNGDKFLISVGNCSNPSAAQLGMERLAQYEKPLAGVGEQALSRVKKYPKKGSSEVGVTVLQGNFMVSLVHTSTAGQTDLDPLIELVRKVLARL